MPILRTYGDASILGAATYQAGQQAGRAARMAQQRAADQDFIRQQQASRNRIVEMETAANLARDRDRDRGHRGGHYGPAKTGPEEVVNEFARQRSALKEQQSLAAQAANDEQAQRQGIMSALEQAYQGREKDFAYHYAKERLAKGQTIPERMLAGLGIESASTAEVSARDQADLEAGQIDTAEPRTERERLIRRSLTQGRPEDIAAFLDQREKMPNLTTGERALTTEALSARTQLQGFAESISDKATLQEVRKTLEDKKVSPEALSVLDDRIAALEKEDIELKAPVAFEQAVGLFETKLQALQKQENRALNVSERRTLLAGTLKETAKSYGLTIEQLGEFVRANDERRREAEMLVQKAQDAIVQARIQQAGPTAPAGAAGQAQPAQPTEPRRFRRPDFGVGGME